MRPTARQTVILILPLLAAVNCFAETKPASQRHKDGEAIYRFACARCHDHGEGGAPIIGKSESWTSRSTLWEAVLFEHADKGYLSMPAGGGDARLSDYDVDVAAEYMVTMTFPERPED